MLVFLGSEVVSLLWSCSLTKTGESYMKKKKVVVFFGVDLQHQAVCQYELKQYNVRFVATAYEALMTASSADVLVFNIDGHSNIAEMLDGHESKVVLITRSSKNIGKGVKFLNGETSYPICCREVPEAIMEMFATA